MLTRLAKITGTANVLHGDDMQGYARDWMGKYTGQPLAVVRPADTNQVSDVMQLASETKTPVVPISGNTGLVGGTYTDGGILLSLERLNTIREIRPEARIAIVEAGVIIANLHDAVDEHGLIFPLLFGARGSAMIGGALSTNAGGSNVLRYGNTRALCLGLEVVLPSGEVMNLMSELHKDNAGYDLRDLFIGAEGTLGVITAAVLKLFPKPAAYATAMVAVPNLAGALTLLNRLQMASGGAVEAFEYMPGNYVEMYQASHPETRPPFDTPHDVNILIELGATAPRDVTPDENGEIPLTALLEQVLVDMMEQGLVLDAVVAQNDTQRAGMWTRREAAAEVVLSQTPRIDSDICVALDKVAPFLEQMDAHLQRLDKSARNICVAHLGDGNIHYSVLPSSESPELADRITETIEDVVQGLGGSFSAEHGVGLSKKPSMARRKDKAALGVMRQIKTALDPLGIMNPGKVLP
ncbi:FAD-binding oxidoreductase [Profundibacter amoris]|uniref:FAD-binding oxidoreductase n=1 Tax=Profundibacter amoris TaxID=2171755 RepID=A0A347UIU7_9RHOB|nr:FAD-binding oxidoreductase [Profundibacter amoris]AXX98775.1 FAD-binding oxidoreductase [Profundibacter amoris]